MLRGIGGRIGMLLRYILLKSITKRCGDNVSVHQYVFLLNPENLELGSNISIHPFCYIDAVGGIVIGDDVSIAHASTVMSSEHNYTRMDQPIKDQGVRLAKTNFSSDVWVGAGVRVLAGASIGQGVVLAAGFTTSLAPTTRTTSVCGKVGLISSISTNCSYGTFASASKTFICPGIRPATG